ncbi:MAG: sodium:proton antiporter [Zetaproteobacteria bacterium CG12_big_fil_rev_8_21_14_0_65_54_13]|nr:MAG: sodium:proton antiporter [Zetaproteobacteria bacterium CG23_combo_of_CG06-09_8_20_14_all_54_7]PIW44163.1 MAG: sodium:proton antiporter [Zetaproteobacteria bacterium CG12_big_fil_rev_8_21_14_0_65_54_13]
MELDALTMLAGILVLGFASQVLAWWLKVPAILFLLIAGLIAGPTIGLLDPDAMFGDLMFPLVSMAVAIILFEGSMSLHFSQIREVGGVIQRLVSIGAVSTWLIISLITHWAMPCSWEVAFLFGAITVVTGPTVIIPMLRTVRPTADIANILRWEGIIIDPIGAIFAVLVYEFIIAGTESSAFGHTAIVFGEILLTGFALGALGGQLLGTTLRRHWLPEYMHNFGALSLVIGLFALSNSLVTESGLLTVTIMGIWLANMKNVDLADLLNFKESLSLLLISGLFIMLAARIEWIDFNMLGWGAVVVLLGMQFIARPVSVLLSTAGSPLSWQERAMICWVAPRGIVAAAVSALFALHLQEIGVPQAEILVPLTFLVIIVTVVLQSMSARWLARALDVAEPDGHGFLIIGANKLGIEIGKALKKQGLRVLLVDSHWENTRKARMDGLPVYFGNAVSEHADRHLDMIGLTGILALSWRDNVNSLACMRYRNEFGVANTYALGSNSDDEAANDLSRYTNLSVGQRLFSAHENFRSLSSRLKEGYAIHSTHLSEEFTFAHWQEQHGDKAIPLFAISKDGQAEVFTTDKTVTPANGDTLISMAMA